MKNKIGVRQQKDRKKLTSSAQERELSVPRSYRLDQDTVDQLLHSSSLLFKHLNKHLLVVYIHTDLTSIQ